MDTARIVAAILLPPLGVAMQEGVGRRFWINVLLTILGYVPGIVHALHITTRPLRGPPSGHVGQRRT